MEKNHLIQKQFITGLKKQLQRVLFASCVQLRMPTLMFQNDILSTFKSSNSYLRNLIRWPKIFARQFHFLLHILFTLFLLYLWMQNKGLFSGPLIDHSENTEKKKWNIHTCAKFAYNLKVSFILHQRPSVFYGFHGPKLRISCLKQCFISLQTFLNLLPPHSRLL